MIGPAETTRNEQVASVVSLINRRFGAETITHGIDRLHRGFFLNEVDVMWATLAS